MEYIVRQLGKALKDAHNVFPVVTLTGPRQSGKTTLCRHLYPDIPYINFENIQTVTSFQENPVSFLDNFRAGAIIDEAQLEPSVFRALQTVVDEDKFRGNERKFIITGSSNFAIMANTSESMAGRTIPLTLLPFSFSEISEAATYAPSTNELMWRGGYPQIWVSPAAHCETIIQGYIDTYVERDLRQIINVKDLNKFIKFLGLCAGRVGTELNRSSLAVETGVAVATIDSWLSVLEASYVIWLLPPWSTNVNKRLTKSPKLYFCDTAVLCYLLGIRDASQLENYPLRGAIFENMVINNFLKGAYNAGKKPRLSFFRDKTGREIDLLVESLHGINAFEIKASTGFNPDYFKHIRYFEKTFPQKVLSATIIYDGTEILSDPSSGLYNFRDPRLYCPPLYVI